MRPNHDPSRVAPPAERQARHRTLDELRELARAATPGPWRWDGYASSFGEGRLRIASFTRGRPIVMGFRRKGMGGAEPEFWDRRGEGNPLAAGEWNPAHAIALREVMYREDVVALDNPDARWLAAADPTTVLRLLDELAALRPGNGNDQRSLAEQMADLHVLATRAGLYDAADWLRGHIESLRGAAEVAEQVRDTPYCMQVWGDADKPCSDSRKRGGGHLCSLLKHSDERHVCGCGSRW